MLSSSDISKLHRIVSLAKKLIAKSKKSSSTGRGPGRPRKRIRRTGRELVQFRKMLKAQRRKGMPVAKLAQQHGITPAYIYQL